MDIKALNQFVGVTPFPALRVETKTASGMPIKGAGLVPLTVVVAAEGFPVGQVLYLDSGNSVLEWATRRYVLKDSESEEAVPFILAPVSAVRMVADSARYSVDSELAVSPVAVRPLIKQL